ncbi:hypothetical protein HYPSUDRAFT_1064401 [Hypholoma sublateritium FD-334 SS-4]|uniref:Uncharacterized protein n=1 Tax=Hypholoma sublateritium (strain FD-334 SS-4) TaxID=945553 RepID=A0A0D2P898_HYPSF|nr:hypothetical protein HYPSUDRAFT_1064401 [Hypholoma sublateritium FD-334 SS-4]
MSWWTFPFERLIGVLQRINTNNKIGGPLEQTILESYSKGANLRRWLRRSDCPEVIRQFKVLFDKAFSSHIHADSEPRLNSGPLPVEVAHYRHDGVNFSRAKTHMGNSLILYYPTPTSASPIAGSIQKITTSNQGVRLHVQRQASLEPGQRDPFMRYPSFPAKTYSAEMQHMSHLDIIGFPSVVTHVARYEFKDRAVIMDLSRVRVNLTSNILSDSVANRSNLYTNHSTTDEYVQVHRINMRCAWMLM